MFETLQTHSLLELNKEAYIGMLKYFLLSHKTKERILQYVNNRFVDKRHFISIDNNPKTDLAYQYYLKCLSNKDNSKYQNLDIWSFETFSDGKLIIEKQEFKLFKFLKKHGLLTKGEIDKINTLRVSNKESYVCISRNPLDFIFCSTQLSFSSCLSLKSEHGYAFGLGSLILDPNRYIVYLTNGIRGVKFKGINAIIPNMICRTWGIMGKDNILYLVRYYPEKKMSFSEILNKNSVKCCEPDKTRDNFEESKFEFEIPTHRYELGYPFSHIYEDPPISLAMDVKTEKGKYIHEDRWDLRYKEPQTLPSILNRYKASVHETCDIGDLVAKCEKCKKYVLRSDINLFLDSDLHKTISLCDDCFNERFITCMYCLRRYEKGSIFEIYRPGDRANFKIIEFVCPTCVKKYSLLKCRICNRVTIGHEANFKDIMHYLQQELSQK